MVIQPGAKSGGEAAGAFSLPRAMWTAALAGGAFGTVLSSTPILSAHPFLWYAIGAGLAIYVLRKILEKAGREPDARKDIWVAMMSGLLPGIVQWMMLPWTYAQYQARVDEGYREALKSPHIPLEQAEAMHRFWHSAAGPWVAGALGFVSIIVWSALIGMALALVLITLSKDRNKGNQES